MWAALADAKPKHCFGREPRPVQARSRMLVTSQALISAGRASNGRMGVSPLKSFPEEEGVI